MRLVSMVLWMFDLSSVWVFFVEFDSCVRLAVCGLLIIIVDEIL